MEVSSSFGRIEKFSGRPGTISLREFKEIFPIVVCELELKYGVNCTEAYAFKQLVRYVHSDIGCLWATFCKDFGRHLDSNPAYTTAITTASQAALQATIAHHGTMPNNLDLVPTLVNLSLQQLNCCYYKHSSHH